MNSLLAANEIQNQAVPALTTMSAGQGLAFYIATLWKTIVMIGGIAFLIYLVWGALEWITASGDKNDLDKARHKITNALIGLTIMVASFAIVKFVEAVFGINLLSPQFQVNY
jgi:arginine exporter protein ArgO